MLKAIPARLFLDLLLHRRVEGWRCQNFPPTGLSLFSSSVFSDPYISSFNYTGALEFCALVPVDAVQKSLASLGLVLITVEIR
jgi:hypothetical protein